MALVIADRVKETTTTSGTGTLNLAGAVAGFQTFVDGIGSGNTCHYCIVDGNSWEVGLGTVTDASPDTLSRDSIISSSNGDSAINLSGGSASVFCTLPGDATAARAALGIAASVTDGSTLSTGLTFPNTGLHLLDTDASHDLIIKPGSNITTADKTLTLTTGDADRNLTISGDTTLGGGSHSGTNTGDVTLAGTPDYITISGQVITRNAVDLAADVTGALPPANGGTGLAETVAFLAYNSVDDTNQTGNGATATVDFDAEIFDLGGDFASDTFTAPETGRYALFVQVQCSLISGTTADTARVNLVTSNRDYRYNRNFTNSFPSTITMPISVIADMDAGDTATVTVTIGGMAGDTVSVVGSSVLVTFFSGYLLRAA